MGKKGDCVLFGWQESDEVVSAVQIAMYYVFGGKEEEAEASLYIILLLIIMTEIKLINK